MAKATIETITLLRRTADALQKSEYYQWGHMGACNCGFLAQQVTLLSKGEIHARALQRYGDWNEQLNDYCPSSGLLFDDIISSLLQAGFDIVDLKQLETLSDPSVVTATGIGLLSRNSKQHVLLYIRTWATLLEERFLNELAVPSTSPYYETALV
jgi:hypothetical protein